MRNTGQTRDDHAGGTAPNEAVRQVIADAVTADTRRQDLLVEYARALGPDPSLEHLDDGEVARAVRIGAAEIAAATCRWLQLLAELVVRGTWAEEGARNPAHWLSWALGIATSTGREHVRVALRLRECPLVREQFAAGRISYSKVRAITRVATPGTEQLLLEWADSAPAHVLERIITDTRRQQHGEADPSERTDLGVRRRWCDDGTYELVLRADATTGLEVEQHLDRLVELDTGSDDPGSDNPGSDDPGSDDPGSDDTPDSDRTATGPEDATDPAAGAPARLTRARREVDLVAGALAAAVAAGPDDVSGGDRHLVVLHATASQVLGAADAHATGEPEVAAGEAEDASAEAPPRRTLTLVRDGRGRTRAMSSRALWRLACSARLDLAIDRDGHPEDLGRARRTPDARLRRLLLARDRTCRFPGCGATRYLHAHHVQHWGDDGPTDLDNLVLLCGFHHTTVHTGWELRPAGPGRWSFHAPGRARPHRWAGRLPLASAEAVLEAGRAHAHDLDPTTRAELLQPRHWDGDEHGYDHDMAISILVDRLALAA